MEAELRAVFDGLWVALAEATGRRTPLTLGYLGTIGLDGTPQVRAVILRRTDHDDGAVYVATRADSAKVAEVGREPRVGLTFVDGDAGVQLRLTGRARVVVDAGERALAWQGFADHNRALYRSALVPGSPLPGDPVGGPGGDGPGDEETEFALRVGADRRRRRRPARPLRTAPHPAAVPANGHRLDGQRRRPLTRARRRPLAWLTSPGEVQRTGSRRIPTRSSVNTTIAPASRSSATSPKCAIKVSA